MDKMVTSGSSAASSTTSPATGAGVGKPRTRQRIHKPAPELDVPDIAEDAAERKRVLNVLAQRRYRDRKRQERSKAQGKATATATEAEEETNESPATTTETDPTLLGSASELDSLDPSTFGASPANSHPSTDGGVNLMDLELGAAMDWNTFDGEDLSSLLPGTTATLPGTTMTTTLPVLTAGQSTGPLVNAFDFSNFTAPEPFSLSTSPASFSSSKSINPDDAFSFPDSYLLPVHELTLLKGLMRISTRIGCDTTTIWAMDSLSPFNLGTGTPAANLPTNWQPTASQLSVPHHPAYDLLPWPSARDRMLMFLALPDEARPPVARGPMCLVNFVYDLEDGHEGVKIYGDDPCDPEGWEIGQVLFERWWFLFDRRIVENSNRWRELRGAPPLLKDRD